MNHSFPRLLTLLRKEKKLSQKEAAKALGISQALLSHYENGIRECGLDFLVKAADYYQVSCDYLLGKTTERDSRSRDELLNKESGPQEMHAMLQTLKALRGMTEPFHCPDLDKAVLSYLEKSFYKIFRLLYSANSKNPQNLFKLNRYAYRSRISADMLILENDIDLLVKGRPVPGMTGVNKGEAPAFQMDVMSREDAASTNALLAMIRNAEQSYYTVNTP